jgi:plasmid stabilization system protein ParE
MAEPKYSVILAHRADTMLLSHIEFLARVNANAARHLIKDFKKMTEMLAENPFQFSFADELDVPDIPIETYRKCIFAKRYKAIYLVEENNVYVDAIIDCRQENRELY